MFELKVQCDCGQRFKFDVEPVKGRMPFTVNCPACGADGTEKANLLLQEKFDAMAPSAVADAPPDSEPGPAVVAQPRLRINVAPAPARSDGLPPPPPPIAPATEIQATPPPAAGRPVPGMLRPAVAGAGKKKSSFGMGLLGGFIGAFIGALIYFLVFKYTGLRFKLLAIGVGALAGWAAEYLGKGEGSKELGVITAVFVLCGIIGAQYLVALGWWHEIASTIEDSGYSASVKQAREVVKAIPTGSDEEIRIYLAKEEAGDDARPDPKAITDEAVKQFHDNDLPEYQNLAAGKITKEQYDAKNGIDPAREKKFKDDEEGTFKGVFMLLLLSRLNLFHFVSRQVWPLK